MHLVYDRGTVVLRPPPDHPPIQQLRSMCWDPRVEAWRAPACKHAVVVDELTARGVSFRDETQQANLESRRDGEDDGVGLRDPPLREHQEAAVAAWDAAGRRGVVVLPTGSGKTRVAVAVAARLRVPVLVLVPTRALLSQWASELARWTDARVGRLGDGWRELRPITVATYESASRRAEDLGDRFGLLVGDEAHHCVSGRWADSLRCSLAHARLGLTATPPEPGPGADRLDELMGPLVFLRSVAELTPTHLAPLQDIVLEVVLPPEQMQRQVQLWRTWTLAARAVANRRPGMPWRDLVRALASDPEGRRALAAKRMAERIVATAAPKIAVARSLLKRHAGERVLIFTNDNDAAYALSSELLIPAVTADVRGRERESLLKAFADGRLRALVSSAVLNEGIDVPEARVAIVLGGRLGRREHVQRTGRILRPGPDKKTALLYEVVVRGTFEDRRRRRRELPSSPQEFRDAARTPS